ncbi:MAG: MotA/TolQ/ExbB proton channel family protein [Spirochaetia bacterium]|nr:MotA/TolQ/ExbB proton channel family protein [Spirochaetia bacterium]
MILIGLDKDQTGLLIYGRFALKNTNYIKQLKTGIYLAMIIVSIAGMTPVFSQEKPDQAPAAETTENQPEAIPQKQEEEKPQESKESLWLFIYRGGITMIGLGIISVLIMAFAIERALFFRREKIGIKGFYDQMQSALDQGGLDAFEKMLAGDKRLISRVLLNGLRVKDKGRERMERAIVNSSTVELGKLEKGLNLLNNLGNLAPLLGFFGTVMGMRHSFLEFVLKAAPTARDLAGGVEEALITTIAGLFIAIPAFLIYNLFLYYIDNVTIEIEKCANIITDQADYPWRYRLNAKEEALKKFPFQALLTLLFF